MALSIQAWFIADPFSVLDINGGSYFGTYAKTWDRHGFFFLRGVPIWNYDLSPFETGQPYLNHPPGFAWVSE